MKYTDIKTVLTIYEERSFTAAAKRLFISQPAISQTVAQLEKELNLSLFVRNKGEVIPTEACEKFVAIAQSIVNLWQSLEEEMASCNSEYVLKIGTTSFFFRFFSHNFNAMFSKRFPDIQYTLIEDSARNVELLTHKGQLDFCFTRLPLHQTTLRYEPLFTEEILFAVPASHPVCQQYPSASPNQFPTIDLSAFADSDFVMVNNPSITPRCSQMCEEAGYRPRIAMSPVTWEHIILGICSGKGVGFLSNLHIKKDDCADLRFFHIDSNLAKMSQVVAYRPSYKLNPKARHFIDSFKGYVQDSLDSIDVWP